MSTCYGEKVISAMPKNVMPIITSLKVFRLRFRNDKVAMAFARDGAGDVTRHYILDRGDHWELSEPVGKNMRLRLKAA